jgi:hypothetical protein
MKNETKWMIRDVKHGKVFSFKSYDEMTAFIISNNAYEKQEFIKQLKKLSEANTQCAQ